jgi:SAM-dependent methyltransferase
VTAAWLLRQLPPDVVGRQLACLDVGSWRGELLSELPQQWRRVGIEPSPEAVRDAAARGIDVREGRVEDADVDKEAWDLVTMLDVAEHLLDPRLAFGRVVAFLRPGGRLIVLTGDAGAVGARIWGADWYYLNYPEHVSVFTRASIRLLLEDFGLEVDVRRVAHPLASARRDVREFVRHLRGRSASRSSCAVSLDAGVGVNAVTLSRALRRRDHLFVMATRPTT